MATITVTTADGGKTAACAITVPAVAVTGITLNQSALTITVGNTATLSATVAPANATNKAITWSTSNAADWDFTGISATRGPTLKGFQAGTQNPVVQ